MKSLLCVFLASACAGAGASPYATQVISYDQGANPTAPYTDMSAALGAPERFTGEGVFPSGVTPFNPAFGVDEIVSVGAGGHLTLRFDAAITDDASHRFGVDFIVFGNAAFVDQSYFDEDPGNNGSGVLGADPFLFGVGGDAEIWVSENGTDWELAAVTPLGMFPTLGYLDQTETTPATPGLVPSDFTRAMDPTLSPADLAGLSYADLIALYDGSGGGLGVDLASTGLDTVRFVRFVNAGTEAFEIDAVSIVPAPGTLACAGCWILRRRRRA